jgi:predicted negative regulator of RcsB-dependent stress response
MAKQNISTAPKGKKVVKEDEVLINVADVTHEAQHWLEEYKKPLMYGGIALAVILAASFFYKNYQSGNQVKAVQAMWKAEQMFEQDSFAVALTNPGGGYEGFLGIISKYGRTPAGNMAKYYAGVSYLQLGKFDEAIKHLDDFSPSGTVSPTMKNGALADAYSEKQDFAKALKYYKAASTEGAVEDLKALYLKRYAMLSEKQGDFSSALSAYNEIKEKYATTADGRDIEKFIARAEAKKK